MTGTRDAAAGTITASQASTIHPVVFAKLEFDSGTVAVHSELGDLTFGSVTYTGVGRFGTIGTAEESSDLSRTPITLTMSNIDQAMGSVVLGEYYQGRLATVYLGYLNMTTRALVADPAIIYKGLINNAQIDQGKTFSVTISIESRLAAWERPITRRYNNADQILRYPGDKGMEFVEQAVNKPIIWGGDA